MTEEERKKELERARGRRFYHANKEKCIEAQRKRRKANPDKAREQSRRSERKRKIKRYGLTLESYSQLIASQNNLCAICNKENTNKRDFHIDHCHSSGKVRGLLCHQCNLLLGNAKDSPEILENAIRYLNRQ